LYGRKQGGRMITLENVNKIYSNGLHAVKDVNLKVNEGDIFGIIGLSGAGKSSLIRLINRLEEPTSGKIFINGENVLEFNKKQLLERRKKIGMIFQHFNLLSSRTVEENVAFALEIANWNKKDIGKRVSELLEIVGLSDKAKYYPSQLSGGQKQRVSIARALANNPDILLSDEATSALDVSIQKNIIELLVKLQKERDLCIVFICHDIALLQAFAHEIAVMYLGNVLEVLPGDKLKDTAYHPYTKALLSSLFSINMNFSEKIASIEGDVPSPINLPSGCVFQGRCKFVKDKCKGQKPILEDIEAKHKVACYFTKEINNL